MKKLVSFSYSLCFLRYNKNRKEVFFLKQDHNNLYYHLLLITRGRSKILTADIVNKAKEVFEQDCEPYGMKLTKDIYEDDFLHLVYLGDHNIKMTDFVKDYKTHASDEIKKAFPAVASSFGDSALWSDKVISFMTLGGIPMDILRFFVASEKVAS